MRRPRWLRIARGIAYGLLGTGIFLGLVVLAALVYLRSDSGRARVRKIAVQRVRESVPGFDFDHLGGNLTRSIVLEGVRIRDREGRDAVAADRIAVRYDLPALLSHTIRIHELRIEHVRVAAAP